jgi:hypothetical protein
MNLKHTPELAIKSVSTSSGSSRKITIKFLPPFQPDLYLGILTLVENDQISGYSGKLSPGSQTQAGNGTIQVNHAKFQTIWDFISHTQLFLLISYDADDDTVNDLEISSTQPLVKANLTSVESQVESPA